MFGLNRDFELFKRTHLPNQRNCVRTIRMVLTSLIGAPVLQDPAHQLVLVFNRSDNEITLHAESTARTSDIVDIQVRYSRSDQVPFSIDHWIMEQC